LPCQGFANRLAWHGIRRLGSRTGRRLCRRIRGQHGRFFDDVEVTLQRQGLQVVQENHYYPFGMQMMGLGKQGAPDHRFTYNGKEGQQEFGLGWHDYGARMYDAQLGRFHKVDRFAEKYYGFTPYQYAANNPISFIDINGDSIEIYSKKDKQSIIYHEGTLYWKGTGKRYDGRAYNGKGKLRGFVKHTKNALDQIRTVGTAGKELIDYFQNSTYKNIRVQEGVNNGESNGLITWNPGKVNEGIPNQDGSTGRAAYIGLAHEIGHTWDVWENGYKQANETWYLAADGTEVKQSEKFATWWENRVRAENGVSLREFYSFTFTDNGRVAGEESGRVLIEGTRKSSHINMMGKHRHPFGAGWMGVINNLSYKY